jgi:hypothetical protein
MCNDARASQEEIPNHMIVWLDQHIGRPEHCQLLKAAFSSTTDPNHTSPICLFNEDDKEINRTVGFEQVIFEGVRFLLAAFTNIEDCVKFLEQHQNKRIFFITSGSMGRSAIPLIMHKCKNIFTDPVTHEPYQSIYVFCLQPEKHMDWMLDHRKYLATYFTFDKDLLVRIIRDVADYFLVEGKRLMAADPPNYPAVYNRLNWTHTLYSRYIKMENESLRKEFAEVNELIEKAEQAMKSLSDDES